MEIAKWRRMGLHKGRDHKRPLDHQRMLFWNETQRKQLSPRLRGGPDTGNSASILVHDKERNAIQIETCKTLRRFSPDAKRSAMCLCSCASTACSSLPVVRPCVTSYALLRPRRQLCPARQAPPPEYRQERLCPPHGQH